VFEARNLTRPGVQGVTLSLAASELVCLSGPSGAGKTLMLRALADLDVSDGEVLLEGAQRERLSPVEWRTRVGYLPADSRWWAATVGDHFTRITQTHLRQLGFSPEVTGWRVERLSSGERQRLALARLIANRPSVLLLDEPTANLDPANTERVEQLVTAYLAEMRAACLWVTHDAEQIERIADRALYLDAAGLHAAETA
jgi:ABC-type iron transport system FetAB ATPase subunit